MSQKPYPQHQPGSSVAASPALPEIEQAVLDYWAGDKTFQASVDARDAGSNGDNEFVFYDGPPFANGLPHYGHLLTGFVKDLVRGTRPCAGAGSSAVSAGTRTACLPRWKRKSSSASPARPRSWRWAWTSSTRPAAPRVGGPYPRKREVRPQSARFGRRIGGLVHPAQLCKTGGETAQYPISRPRNLRP